MNGMWIFRQQNKSAQTHSGLLLLKLGWGSEVSTDKLWMFALQKTRQTLTRAMACLPHWAALHGHAIRPDKGDPGFQMKEGGSAVSGSGNVNNHLG